MNDATTYAATSASWRYDLERQMSTVGELARRALRRALIRAAREGDLKTIEGLLAFDLLGILPGDTALFEALLEGQRPAALALMRAGAKPADEWRGYTVVGPELRACEHELHP